MWKPWRCFINLWSCATVAAFPVSNKSVKPESFNMCTEKKESNIQIPMAGPLATFSFQVAKTAGSSFFEERWILVTFVQLCQYTVAGVLCQVSQRSCIETTRCCWESMEGAEMSGDCGWGVCLTHAVALWWQVVVWTLVDRRPGSRQERLTGQWRCRSESWLCHCREAPPPGKQYTDRIPLDTVKSAVERGSKRDSLS